MSANICLLAANLGLLRTKLSYAKQWVMHVPIHRPLLVFSKILSIIVLIVSTFKFSMLGSFLLDTL